MKTFITGATGFIGGHIARQLIDAGHEVTALARTPEKAQHLAGMGITLAKGDVTDIESMRAPMSGVDGVLHIAGWYKVGARDQRMAEAINIEGTRNVCQLMQELGIPRGVYTSTLAIFSDTRGQMVDERFPVPEQHFTEYNRTKARAHQVAEAFIDEGLPLVIVLPGAVYGPDDPSSMGASVRLYLRGLLPIVPKGAAFCWCHVEDTAAATIAALEQGTPGESYIISGEARALQAVFKYADRVTDKRRLSIPIPPAIIKLNAALMKALGAVVTVPPTFAWDTLRSSAGVTYLGSDAKARRELGFAPRTPEEGLKEWFLYECEKMGKKPMG